MLLALLQTAFKTELTSKERSIRTIYCPYKGAAKALIDQNDAVIELGEAREQD
jgi:hypothetical protein